MKIPIQERALFLAAFITIYQNPYKKVEGKKPRGRDAQRWSDHIANQLEIPINTSLHQITERYLGSCLVRLGRKVS